MSNLFKKLFRKIEVIIRYFIFSIKHINKPHIDDVVYLNGVECIIIQGSSDLIWWLRIKDSYQCFDDIHIDRIVFIYTPSLLIKRFYKTYNFLLNVFYKTDINSNGTIKYSYFNV